MRNRRRIFNNKRFGWAILLTLIICFSAIIFGVCTGNSAFATTSDEVVETNFFGNYTDDGEGCGVYMILNMIIDILSIGIAITGVIGVTLVGIQYMTAKDSEEKTRKAKNRMLEIVIGLVTYAALFAGVQWLLPGGLMNNSCRSISDEKLAQMKEDEKKKEEEVKKKQQAEQQNKKNKKTAKKQKQEQQQKNKAYKKCMENAAPLIRSKICKIEDPRERISETTRLLAWPKGTAWNTYSKRATANFRNVLNQIYFSGGGCSADGKSCAAFVDVVVLASGVDPNFSGSKNNKGFNTGCIYNYLVKSKKWVEISKLGDKVPRAGDISVKPRLLNGRVACNTNAYDQSGHVVLYAKDASGKTVTAEANNCGNYGIYTNNKWSYNNINRFTVFRYVGK